MGELIGDCAEAICQYAQLFEGCFEEKENIATNKEEVASVHNLLSKTIMDIS